MSLVKFSVEQYRKINGDAASQKTIDSWLRVREYEIETLGAIHRETGTFFNDEHGMDIDWEQGEWGLSIREDGSYFVIENSAFGVVERTLADWDSVSGYLNIVFKNL